MLFGDGRAITSSVSVWVGRPPCCVRWRDHAYLALTVYVFSWSQLRILSQRLSFFEMPGFVVRREYGMKFAWNILFCGVFVPQGRTFAKRTFSVTDEHVFTVRSVVISA